MRPWNGEWRDKKGKGTLTIRIIITGSGGREEATCQRRRKACVSALSEKNDVIRECLQTYGAA